MMLAPLMLLAACEPQVPVAEDFIPDYKGWRPSFWMAIWCSSTWR
ncbi:hypothetical protein [Sulfitobacter profundi]|uniref:Uncharacterized protein n=1 Tax=Sulfitobacter profundi TaxID=2679961 RepID=A0ABW1Z190_9RHOB